MTYTDRATTKSEAAAFIYKRRSNPKKGIRLERDIYENNEIMAERGSVASRREREEESPGNTERHAF